MKSELEDSMRDVEDILEKTTENTLKMDLQNVRDRIYYYLQIKFKTLASGVPCAVSVTILDALVLARSAFESSMNYRSALILGAARELDGDEKIRAFNALTDHLLPRRRDSLRPLNDDEIKQTTMLTLPLDEASVKISSKFPKDDEEDLGWPVWAGNIPIEHRYGTPIPDPRMTTAHPLPEYLKSWPEGRT